MKTVLVPVKFRGHVKVEMPDHLDDQSAKVLAEKLAIAQVLATCENPDCGECLESACEEFVEETDCSEEDFDAATAVVESGSWELNGDVKIK